MLEELAQYRHHIVSAKEIGKALLQGVPDTSPFHRSITAAQETLYYINSIGSTVHPSNGSSFLINRSSFFLVHQNMSHQAKQGLCLLPKQGTNFNLNSSTQKLRQHLKVPKPKASLIKVCPLHQELNNSSQEVGSMILLPQLNRHCTPSMMSTI